MTQTSYLQQIIDKLELIPHPEGGYFREIYRSNAIPMASQGQTDEKGYCFNTPLGSRNLLTSIYWMPTAESRLAWWVRNQSDHIHYYHSGASLTYHIIHPDGMLETCILGPRIELGEKPQVIVKANCWKAAHLTDGQYCLLGEAVAPGFDFQDFQWATELELKDSFLNLPNWVFAFIKPEQRRNFEIFYKAEKI